jgi:uncharacterized protein (TIGR03067 family)
MRTAALFAAAALALAAHAAPAPLPRPDTSKEDLKRMQGTWELTAHVEEGRPITPERLRAVVKGRRLTLFADARSEVYELTVNARARPKAIDFKLVGRAYLVLAVYSLRGDTFTICMLDYDEGRPGNLAANNRGEECLTFSRVRKP